MLRLAQNWKKNELNVLKLKDATKEQKIQREATKIQGTKLYGHYA